MLGRRIILLVGKLVGFARRVVIYSRWTLANKGLGTQEISYGTCESAGEEAKGLDPDKSKIRGGGETDDPTSGPPLPQKGTPQESSELALASKLDKIPYTRVY